MQVAILSQRTLSVLFLQFNVFILQNHLITGFLELLSIVNILQIIECHSLSFKMVNHHNYLE